MKKIIHSIKGRDIGVGDCFGWLMVIDLPKKKIGKSWCVACRCVCGSERYYIASNLIGNRANSCGCSRGRDIYGNRKSNLDQTSHGLSSHPLYQIYNRMKTRCYNKNSDSYPWYGAKGVGICQKWLDDFTEFYRWALSAGWCDGLTIERIDPNLDYSPSNCEFITKQENAARMNAHHNKNKTGAFSKESRDKIRATCVAKRGVPCRVYLDSHNIIEFDSVSEVVDYLTILLARSRDSVSAQVRNIFRGKCKTIGGYKIEKI